MLNIFATHDKPMPDIGDGHENVSITTCNFMYGSPRDLLIGGDMQTLAANLKEIRDCTIQFRVFSNRKLLKAQRLISENETVGRYDVIAGLKPKPVILAGETQTQMLPCVGDDEIEDGHRGIILIPSRPIIELPLKLKVSDFQILIPQRDDFERRMLDSIARDSTDREVQPQIISRNLKLALHNGHTLLGGDWMTYPLEEVSDDREVLITPQTAIDVPGYIPHELMSLVFLIEYEIGVPSQHRNYYNAQAMLNSTLRRGKAITTVTVGAALFVPSNGRVIFLRNHPHSPSAEDSMGIELPLRFNELCSILSTRPIYGASDKQLSRKSKKKLESKRSRDDKGEEEDNDHDENIDDDSILIALNLSCYDEARKIELEHEDEVPTLGVESDDKRRKNLDEEDDMGTERDSGRDRDRDRSRDRDSRQSRSGRGDEEKFEKRSSFSSQAKGVSDSRSGRLSSSFKQSRISSIASDRRPEGDDDAESITDSLVGGDVDASSLRLDPRYYSRRVDADDVMSVTSNISEGIGFGSGGGTGGYGGSQISVPRDRNSLLARTMQAKVLTKDAMRRGDKGTDLRSDRFDDRAGGVASDARLFGDRFDPADLRAAPKTTVAAATTATYTRDISRAARSRLSRHGFHGTMQDSAAVATYRDDNIPASMKRQISVDINLEANDVLSINDVTIQFAGYRSGMSSTVSRGARGGSSSSGGSVDISSLSAANYCPRSVYFSFKFYTCMATRTEPMRLLPAERGEVCVLARDEAHARDEAPLALRYIIDCSSSSPTEGLEFAEYLAHSTLFIDVWDADSMILLGTCGVPLRRIMRQGQPVAKCALECDIINSEMAAQAQGGIISSTVTEGGPVSGLVVGSINLIICNYGQAGKAEAKGIANLSSRDGKQSRGQISGPVEGLNWRAYSAASAESDPKSPAGKPNSAIQRPKNTVRAKPLSETAPALAKSLKDLRHAGGVEGSSSMRSLTSIRGGESLHTLSYDEVVVLFKRFQGSLKGTVQYQGALLSLLDVPSWNAAMKKLLKAYDLVGPEPAFHKEMLLFADAQEMIDVNNLQEFFKTVMESRGIATRPEEVAILAHKFTNSKDNGSRGMIHISEVVSYLHMEAEKQDWTNVSKRLRRSAQKAILMGCDIEQLLAEKDTAGTHYCSVNDFKEFLQDLSRYGKLSTKDVQVAIRHFCPDPSKRDAQVSLREIMIFLGRKYVGNLEARLAKALLTEGRTPDDTLRIVREHNTDKSGGKGGNNNVMSYEDIEAAFGVLGVYKDLTHEQVRSVLSKISDKRAGFVAPEEIFLRLGMRIADKGQSKESSSGSSTSTMTADEILKVLLDRLHNAKGVSIEEVFRQFDTNGDGDLSTAELEEGLSKIGLLENIPNWRKQIPLIAKKFDTSGDGMVNLKEFMAYVGVDYLPNVLQRLTKIFAVVIDSNRLTFQDIFKELDTDGNGKLDCDELHSALVKLQFQDITKADAEAVIRQFGGKEGKKEISVNDFINFFRDRVAKATVDRKKKKAARIANKFKALMTKAKAKDERLSTEDIFNHFDKDAGGSLSPQELADGLKKIPQFKSLLQTPEDVQALIDAVDIDGSGEVSLAEFKKFLGDDEEVVTDTPSPQDQLIQRVRDLFVIAEKKGLSLRDAFNKLDTDKNGSVSIVELEATMRSIPHFENLSRDHVRKIIDFIDTDRSGTISFAEFESFVRTGRKPAVQRSLKAPGKDSGGPRSDSKGEGVDSKHALKDSFILHFKRVAQTDGGPERLLAFLDTDGDGIISLAALTRILKRDGVFDSRSHPFSEKDLDVVLAPCVKGDQVNVPALLRLIERKDEEKENAPDDDDNGAGSNDEFEGMPLVKYDFSHDPETKALEKKMRALGRTLAKKGCDVEGLFKRYDMRETGTVRRTEFLEIISAMGMYVLEEGKVLDEAVHEDNEVRRLQLQQVSRLKGGHGASSGGPVYSQQAAVAARRLVMNSGQRGGIHDSEFKEHLESMALINWYRQSQKKLLLQRVLSHSLATTIRIYPRFGKTLFFEHAITNPFAHEERFIVDVNDPELRLVTSFDEWLHLRQVCPVCVGELGPDPIEAEMFDRDAYGNVSVTLLPHETLYIPFTFMTLIPYVGEGAGTPKIKKLLTQRSDDESKNMRGESKEDIASMAAQGGGDDEEDPRRVLEVRCISGTHGHIISVLRVNVCPRPNVTHRTLRFFEPEKSLMRRRIHLMPSGSSQAHIQAHMRGVQKYVHCVEGDGNMLTEGESRVVVEWAQSGAYSSLELFVRYKCGDFPSVGSFTLLLYDDPYQSSLSEVWDVVVQTRQRVDVHTNVGTAASVDLPVRGDKYARRVRCYASAAGGTNSVAFQPDGVFQIVPSVYNRIALNYTPSNIGCARVQINLVDVDSRELMSAWLLTATASAPHVFRSYDVDVVAGRPTSKKIVFKNSWDIAKRYVLTSSQERVMKPRTPILDVAPLGSAYLRLTFSGVGAVEGGAPVEVYLFLNDEHGQNEEAFLFRVRATVGEM